MTTTTPNAGTPNANEYVADEPKILPPKPAFAQDWADLAKWGAIGATTMIFIVLAGMLDGLDGRLLIDPIFSLGYLAVIWVPFALGYFVAREEVLEGIASHVKGTKELVSGMVVGAATGAGLSLLILLMSNFDLRDPLVNWSDKVLDLLQFNEDPFFGVVMWIVVGFVLGTLGAAMHLLPAAIVRILKIVLVTVLFVSVFETFLKDLLKGFGLSFITDFFYAPRGGLTIVSTIVLAAIAGVIGFAGKGRLKKARSQIETAGDNVGQVTKTNIILLIGAAAALVILPIFTGKITNELLANVGIFLLLALGLNIVVGLAGILDLGYVAFFAVGGYTTAILTSPNSPGWAPELPWWVAMIVTIGVAALTGLFIGAPVIRMRGDYLAIVTLGFGEIIRILFLSDWLAPWFGGAQGITNIPPADFGLFEVKGTDPRSVFYLVLVFTAIAIYVSWRLERSRMGRAWMAIREDESVAEAMGINTVNVKLMAFVVGAVLASFGGAIFSAKVGSIFPTSFLILVSIIILVVVIVGGMGNIPGVIVGAVLLIGVLGGPKQPGLLQEFSEYKLLIYGTLLVAIMLTKPEGLVPNARRTRELHQDEFLQDAWLRKQVDEDEEASEAETESNLGSDGPTAGAPA